MAGKVFSGFSALIWGGWVHIYVNADADISTPVKSDRLET